LACTAVPGVEVVVVIHTAPVGVALVPIASVVESVPRFLSIRAIEIDMGASIAGNTIDILRTAKPLAPFLGMAVELSVEFAGAFELQCGRRMCEK